MAGQKFTLTFDANLEVSKMKIALNDVQKSLNGLQLPQNITKNLQSTFQKLAQEVQNFEVQAGKDITSKADFSKLEKSADRINNLFETLKVQLKDIGNLSNKELQKLLPDNVSKNINDANNALKTYNTTLKNIQGTIDSTNTKITEQQNKLKSYQAAINQLAATKSTKVYDSLKQTIQNIDGTVRFETEAEALQRLQNQYQKVEDALTKYQAKVGNNPTAGQQTYITRLTNQLNNLKTAYDNLSKETTTNAQVDTQIKTLESSAKNAQTQITKLQANLQQLLQGRQGAEAQALQTLLNALQQIQGIDFSKFSQDAQGAGQAVKAYLNDNLQQLITNLQNTQNSVGNQTPVFNNFRQQVQQAGAELVNFDNRMREVEQLKSRIQYFFGLNNAIQLVKRTMREAYNTIKELDKAMTETAVVTGFSVGDMWAQLPDYTRRANELGVTTKAAYEAATLYYQQGLKTNEVMAMSNETLKMARIAGLDAAVATDRMTNAIRGFNMEINTTNAQRIDDVYSRLAAISASNVDEISTAMTKVASLAHNANMEFETTAAFLAQIIETTRESAETAGTALKTVVARFSEVKKLVSEGELSGSDEEGELIDVNKVSSALRVAGIDLNKYFLGQVGLDDIFMELASKWNQLTTLQQRYIATQAAGSRQQSRFIALMSDYARTQELVGEAYKANGASAKQFEKTQESLESKLARLKNAWNEFAMGILNSDIVKAGVDILTNLLNGVNALTSGFGALNSGVGSFINTFAKLALLIGGLKVGKGLTAGLFGSMLSAVTGGTIGGGFTNIAAGAMGVNPGANLLATFGAGAINPFKNIGKAAQAGIGKTWGLAQKLGTAVTTPFGMGTGKAALTASSGMSWLAGSGLTGTAAGITGIATALGAVSIAALGVVAAYKAWEKWTPEGQLKVATKLAKEAEENAEKARDVAKSYQEVQEAYKQYDDAVKNATSTTEKDTAIKSKNDYILSLIDRDATYAQYLQSATSESGQIVLTLDEDALAKAADEAAKAAVQANVDSYFAKAGQQDAQANANESKSNRLETRISNLEADYRGNTAQAQELRAEKAQQELQAEAARAAANNYARLGYQELFSDSQLSNDIANALAGALGALYNQTGRLNDNTLTQLQAWTTGSGAQSIMSAIAGDVGNKNLLGLSDDEMLQVLGIDETSDAFKQFADELTKIGSKDLKKFILGIAQANKEIQENNRQKLQEKFNNYGVTDNQQKVFFEMSTPDIQEAVSNTLDQIEGVITSGDYKNLIDILLNPETTEEDIYAIQSFINSINLDDPISAFTRLQDGIDSTDENVKRLAQDILKSNQDIIGSGNLVKVALESAYDDIQKEIDKIIKKNGHITSKNVEELAEAAEDLSIIIDEGVVSIEALAKAINLIEDGRITFEDLNDTVLDLLENMYTFDDLIQDVHDFIADFDEGIDYGEGIDFLVDKIFELEELTNNFEFGNERTQKLWKAFFGTNYEEDWARGEDWMRARVQQMKAWLDNDAYGFFSDKNVIDQLGIGLAGDHELDWDISHYNDLNDLLDDLTNKFKISSEAAKMFVEAFASHGDQNFYNQLQDLSQKSAITSMVNQVSAGKHLWTQDEIDQIAQIAGLDADQLKIAIEEELNNRYKDNGIKLDEIFKVVDGPITGEDFFQQFKEKLALDGKDFDTWISQFIDGKKLKIEELRHALSDMGMDATAQADLIKSISESKELEGAEVDLNNLKFTISSVLGAEVDAQVVKDIVQKIQEATDAEEKKVTINDVETTLDKNGYSTDKAKEILEAIKSYFPDEVQIPLKILPEIIEVESPLNGDLQMQLIEQGQNTGVGVYQSTVEVTPSVPEEAKLASGDLVKVSVVSVEPEIKEENAKQLTDKVESSITEGAEESKAQIFSTAEEAAEYLYNQIKNGEITAGQEGAAVIETSVENSLSASLVGQILYDKLTEAGNQAAYDLVNSLSTILGSVPFNINIQANGSGSAAKGGRVSAYSSGGNHLSPGPALTGEEAPEIVWNKERGYAYITGTNGPEFRNLNPGDRIFNAAETRKILRNSVANGGIVASYARGRWNAENDGNVLNRNKKSGSSGGSGVKEPTKEEWRSDFDWLYNLMEDIAELQREQNKLQEEQNKILESNNKEDTGKDLYENLVKQIANLTIQKDYQSAVQDYRRREMQEFMAVNSGYSEYFRFNDQDQTLEIDWDAINNIGDKETYEKVKDLVSEAEAIQKKMDESDDAVRDIEAQIRQLENIWREQYVSFEKRVLDALVSSYQRVIDNYSDLNDTVTRSNNEILEALQQEIALERQIRDNTETENAIADAEARLAFLRRDTTGGNQVAILGAQKQLDLSRQQYEDTLIDQAISRLQEDNNDAAEQREKQIELMQAQLNYSKENGEFNDEVSGLIADALGGNGELLTNSDLYDLLRQEESWNALSDANKEIWEDELNNTFKEVSAYLLKEKSEADGSFAAAIQNSIESSAIQLGNAIIGSVSQAMQHTNYIYDDSGSNPNQDYQSTYDQPNQNSSGPNWVSEDINGVNYTYDANNPEVVEWIRQIKAGIYDWTRDPGRFRYATGGLNTKPGPAWLDGTPSEPEYVLNARQTDAFLRLADVLPSIFDKGSTIANNTSNNMYLDFHVNVENISDDYDVDQLVERVKEDIYNAASYRNVNVVNFLR